MTSQHPSLACLGSSPGLAPDAIWLLMYPLWGSSKGLSDWVHVTNVGDLGQWSLASSFRLVPTRLLWETEQWTSWWELSVYMCVLPGLSNTVSKNLRKEWAVPIMAGMCTKCWVCFQGYNKQSIWKFQYFNWWQKYPCSFMELTLKTNFAWKRVYEKHTQTFQEMWVWWMCR